MPEWVDATAVEQLPEGARRLLRLAGCMRGGAGLKVRVYPVRVHAARIEVDLAPAA
jgi:hypothetical protein